ncbi:ubiquitin-like modifier-activating enzyme ATG7 isoform X2 [Xenia sp. Carnegie-2017]|uniref:ubiquitin-like modifier-activating enzyme ATG7 isoform X2 n=1 Tax=Xenia sp. Carnegie-2017 TaxID=2897299 RepID=UPI001F033C3E|nr:ubiquitin-like modifier-activating enzyme ATG7 isoform X2 [Xenia sp. Carnegie-2017]
MDENDAGILQFAPFSSAVDAGFWTSLQRKKLEEYHLDESSKTIKGYYANDNLDGFQARFNLDYDALDRSDICSKNRFICHGELLNANTIENFKAFNKQKLLESVGKKIWQSIISKEALEKLELLNQFILITFADLKKYHFYYWFGFPALCPSNKVILNHRVKGLLDVFTKNQISSLQTAIDEETKKNGAMPYFLVKMVNDQVYIDHVKNWELFFKEKTNVVTVGFADPCTLKSNPGWPLRNFLALIGVHWGRDFETLQVICYRDRVRSGIREITHSVVLEFPVALFQSECPKCVGWELNHRQKLGPRMVNLSLSMDPNKLAESAVDLNLKLMRWRLLPELNLEKVSQTKCLLLGAGTLGCNVARLLMKSSWHNLSIPMPGHPVSKNGSEEKSVQETVEKLDNLIDEHDVIFLLLDTRESRWLPTVIAASKKKIVINAALGFDTYLVMRHGLKKFSETENESENLNPVKVSCSSIPGHLLGCYFCNDVVAPGDSTKDRSLDQQCTVSRPGMSYIASAIAVELLVSILQHPSGGYATADTSAAEQHLTADLSSSLGLVPHQIRGFLSRFHQVLPASLAFDKCTACSFVVVNKYVDEGFPFLLRAFNIPKYLEDLTGLTKLIEDTKLLEVWELSEEEDESD